MIRRYWLTMMAIMAAPAWGDAVYDLAAGPGSATFTEGDGIVATWTVTNLGGLDIPYLPWRDTAYLSREPAWSATSTLLGQATNGLPLGAGESYERTLVYPYQFLFAPGDYFLVSRIDTRNLVPEPDEANNEAISGPFTLNADPGVTPPTFERNTAQFEDLGLGNYGVIPQDSMDLPGLDVSHHTLVAPPDGTGAPAILGGIFYYGAGYGGLPGVAIANTPGRSLLFSFAPEAGRIVELGGLDLGAYSTSDVAEVHVWNADFTTLLFESPLLTVPAREPYHFDLNLYSDETVHLVIGPDMWNTGVSNIRYGVSSPVPLPMSAVLLIPALLVLRRSRGVVSGR